MASWLGCCLCCLCCLLLVVVLVWFLWFARFRVGNLVGFFKSGWVFCWLLLFCAFRLLICLVPGWFVVLIVLVWVSSFYCDLIV